jgi:hypothetical protein
MPESGIPPSFLPVIRTLVRHHVDFILIGGVAAVLAGAPVSTFDIDVVHSRDAGNVERLLAALNQLDARYYLNSGVRPNASHLSSPGHQLLITTFGRLDVLGSVGAGRGYEELLPHAVEIEMAPEIRARVLTLETVIALKEELGGDKDRAVLPVLRATLAEIRRRKDASDTSKRG